MSTALVLLTVLAQEPAPLPPLEEPPPVEAPATTAPCPADDEDSPPVARKPRARVRRVFVPAAFSWTAAWRGAGTVAVSVAAAGGATALVAAPVGLMLAAPGFAFIVVPAGLVLAGGAAVGSVVAGFVEAVQGRPSWLLLLRTAVTPVVVAGVTAAGLAVTTAGLLGLYWALGESLKARDVDRRRNIVLGGVASALGAGVGLGLTAALAAALGAGTYGAVATWDGLRSR
ncbi:MAG: hypothetical protein HY904_26265 [Deltaproteobacteria bacterium]|nr:hypothetical protein [Deltaproteobacteria bacterium]